MGQRTAYQLDGKLVTVARQVIKVEARARNIRARALMRYQLADPWELPALGRVFTWQRRPPAA